MKKRLYRSRKDRKIAGVCGGIAEYFEIDSTLVRVLWAIGIVLPVCAILAYLIAMIVMPNEEQVMQ